MKIATHDRVNCYLNMHAVDFALYCKRSFIKTDNLIYGWSDYRGRTNNRKMFFISVFINANTINFMYH